MKTICIVRRWGGACVLSLRVWLFLQVVLLGLSLLPLRRAAAQQPIKEITFTLREDRKDGEVMPLDVNFEPIPYEVRVMLCKVDGSEVCLGAFRSWDIKYGSKPRSDAFKYWPDDGVASNYESGDAIQLRWYEHTAYANVIYSAFNDPPMRYPIAGYVTVTDGSGTPLMDDHTFFGPIDPAGDAIEAEVRIPWRNEELHANAHMGVYTPLSSGGGVNPSFTLPTSTSKDGISISVTLVMAAKKVMKLNFSGFTGQARVRLKSSGDEGFIAHKIEDGGGYVAVGEPYFNSYPYPDKTYDPASGGAFSVDGCWEGLLVMVEARAEAKEGVCVDGRYGGKKVKISTEEFGKKIADSPSTATNSDALPADNDWSSDPWGLKSGEEYWLAPLWSDGPTVEVKAGACKGEMVKIKYAATGDGYTNFAIYDSNGQKVESGVTEVESTKQLKATFTKASSDPCKEVTQIRWGVAPNFGSPVELNGKMEYSFTPGGRAGETITVDLVATTKQTTLAIALGYAAKYQLWEGATQRQNGDKVACGASIMVKASPAPDACVEKVEVYASGSFFGEITAGSSWAVTGPVTGDNANFTFVETVKMLPVKWEAGAGYTLAVQKFAGGTNASPISNGESVECGSGLTITVTPGIAGQSVLSLEVVYEDDLTETSTNSATLQVNNLSKAVKKIRVTLGADPSKLSVAVDETFAGEKVANITVRNETQGVLIWADGMHQVPGGLFGEGDKLLVSYVPVGGCVDDAAVRVQVVERESKNLLAELSQVNQSFEILSAKKGIDVKVFASGKKQYSVSWSSADVDQVLQQDGNPVSNGSVVACGSSIEIEPVVGECEEVTGVSVNGSSVNKDAATGRYKYEVNAKVTEIVITKKPKQLSVQWSSGLGCDVLVHGSGTQSPVQVDCGAEVAVQFLPKPEDGPIQSVTVREEGRAGVVTLTPGTNAGDFSWDTADPSKPILKWNPKGNVTLESVAFLAKHKIEFGDAPDGSYSVSVARKDGSGSVQRGAVLLSGTELIVTVTVKEPARLKVTSINGDAGVTFDGNATYSYTFSLSQDTQVWVDIATQKYKVSFTPSKQDLSKFEVWVNGKGASVGGKQVDSGTVWEYGTKMYVYAEVQPGGAAQDVESVQLVYTPSGSAPTQDEGDGWYSFVLQRSVSEITVSVSRLQPGEVFIVYGAEAIGGEDDPPFGPKATVEWYSNGARLEPGKKHKVKITDRLQWNLTAASRVENSQLHAVCLAVNRQYALRFETTDRQKEYALQDILSPSVYDAVVQQTLTTLRFETYVSMNRNANGVVVLTVRDPRPLGSLKVMVPGGGGVPLEYGRGYKLAGGVGLDVRAEAVSPVVLKEVSDGAQDLGLKLGESGKYWVPSYDPDSKTGNQVTLYALFAREASADNCRLLLQLNDNAGGTVTATRGGALLAFGDLYQVGLRADVQVKANEGYYLKSVRQNGAVVFENTQNDTVQQMHNFSVVLPAGELQLQVHFAPIPRKIEGINAIEAGVLPSVVLYPNPTGGALHASGAEDVGRYEILDVAGRVVARGAHGGGSVLRIDMSGVSVGYYMVRLFSVYGGVRTDGVVKQ